MIKQVQKFLVPSTPGVTSALPPRGRGAGAARAARGEVVQQSSGEAGSQQAPLRAALRPRSRFPGRRPSPRPRPGSSRSPARRRAAGRGGVSRPAGPSDPSLRSRRRASGRPWPFSQNWKAPGPFSSPCGGALGRRPRSFLLAGKRAPSEAAPSALSNAVL